jgi:LmbE family N-acetylglucosaminyl deacetylase
MPSVWIIGLAGVLSSSDAALLHDGLARLASGIRVMYVAAHPDDEHSELLAYLASGRHAQVAYLSLTRGDGGQNRIGSEQGAMLGVLRTQELLAAREIDRAHQLFTRALDFGYSKSAEETLEIWGDDAILEDVVRAIRAFRPHVIITRFPETGETHGHHLASARLARRAFALAGDPSVLAGDLPPWAATRLVHDVPRFLASAPREASGGEAAGLTVDIGGFDPWRGRSFGEIAGESRSRHRSQGFGTVGRRGVSAVRLEALEGATAQGDLLAGIGGAWQELPGGAPLGRAIAAARDAFDPRHPERTVPALLAVRRSLGAMPESVLRDELVSAIDALVVGCAGVFVDVRSPSAIVYPGATVALEVEALRRSPLAVRLDAITVDVARRSGRARAGAAVLDGPIDLVEGTITAPAISATIPADAAPSVLPWLAAEPEGGRYVAEGRARIAPWPEASVAASVTITIGGETMTMRRAVRHVRADPVLGERAREVEVHPALAVTPERRVAIAGPRGATTVALTARGAPGRYEVAIAMPQGWTLSPEVATVELDADGRADIRFDARAGEGAVAGAGRVSWRRAGEAGAGGDGASDGVMVPALEATSLDYPHVPERTVLLPSQVRLVPVALRSLAGHRWRIGYVEGTGDEVASSLLEAGMDVTSLGVPALAGDLSSYDAIVIGARAFNSSPQLHEHHAALLAYAEAGGTVIVQYQTVNRLESLRAPIGPAPFRIDRTRVTDQTATIELLAPDHPALRTPHAIGAADFEGWVQERGLYFAEEWDPAYTPLLRMNDPGEAPADGALLVATHGEGHFVYTGLSFFRQLPAGIPGAYRLFENLIALGRARAVADGPAQGARDPAGEDEPPPFASWPVIYGGVAALLVIAIALFAWLSRRYG